MKNSIIIVIIVGVIIIGGSAVAISKHNSNQESMKSQKKSETQMMQEKQMETEKMKETDAMKGDSMEKDAMEKESASTYVEYSPQALADAELAQQSGRKVVLFFHASWCPFCKEADADFKANINSDKFPKNTTVIKTDYDTQTELKKKYGVTTQHTFVQIDSEGKQITKWISGKTAELKINIK